MTIPPPCLFPGLGETLVRALHPLEMEETSLGVAFYDLCTNSIPCQFLEQSQDTLITYVGKNSKSSGMQANKIFIHHGLGCKRSGIQRMCQLASKLSIFMPGSI
jgi:hypothetical protein